MSETKPVLMYVDDEQKNLTMTSLNLEEHFNVKEFTSPFMALKELPSLNPCIILSDIDMPGMNGIEFLKLARKLYPRARRVIITGKSTEQTAIDAITQTGVTDYLKKPVKGGELLLAILKVYERYQKDEKSLSVMEDLKVAMEKSQKMAILGTFTAGLFHELTGPLHVMSGGIQMVRKNHEDKEKLFAAAQLMEDSFKLMKGILENLHNYTRANTGKIEDIKLFDIVAAVKNLVNDKLRDKAIEFKIDIPEDLTVVGSKAGLYQMIMNLAANAIGALKDDGKLEIHASATADKWILRIQDNGTGMPKEVVERIFQPFFTTKTNDQGTGLGLFIVQKEVEKHKGKMSVNSTPGEGTIFEFEFPNLPLDQFGS